jgi:histone deacetylase 6
MDRPHDATQVFFMGIGDAYIGLVDLLSNYGKHMRSQSRNDAYHAIENCTEPDSVVECLIGFVAETTIQSIKRPTDDTIAIWYYAVSYMCLNFVEHLLTASSTALQDFRQE